MSRRPNPLPWFHRARTNVWHWPLFTIITAVCGSAALLVSFVDKSGRLQHKIAQRWARAVVWSSGCRLTVRGAENLYMHPVAVYASNHTSYMDTPVVFATLPFQFRILAKKDLWKLAFIGWYLNRSGQIAVDTTSPHATLSSLGAGVKALRVSGARRKPATVPGPEAGLIWPSLLSGTKPRLTRMTPPSSSLKPWKIQRPKPESWRVPGGPEAMVVRTPATWSSI